LMTLTISSVLIFTGGSLIAPVGRLNLVYKAEITGHRLAAPVPTMGSKG